MQEGLKLARESVEAEFQLDELDQLCLALNLDEAGCHLLKQAFKEYCKAKGGRRKRKPSAYNIFMGECIRRRPKGESVREAMKRCAEEWRRKRREEATRA